MNNREKLALLKLLDQINDKLYKFCGEQLDDEILEFRAVLMQEGNPDPGIKKDAPYHCGCGHIHRPSERCGER